MLFLPFLILAVVRLIVTLAEYVDISLGNNLVDLVNQHPFIRMPVKVSCIPQVPNINE